MNSVLVVDPDPSSRSRLEAGLAESNQFGMVLSCANLAEVGQHLATQGVSVVLLVQQVAQDQAGLDHIRHSFPHVGLVLLTDSKQQIDQELLVALGMHAQTSATASPLELMVTVAKAMVCRLRPPRSVGKKLFGRFMKD